MPIEERHWNRFCSRYASEFNEIQLFLALKERSRWFSCETMVKAGSKSSDVYFQRSDFADVKAAYALNKSKTDLVKEIDDAMAVIMSQVTSIQQKRNCAEREHAIKKQKLTVGHNSTDSRTVIV